MVPSITARVDETGDTKQLRLTIAPGIRAAERQVEFSGNQGESSDRLRAVIADHGLTRAVWTDPDEVRKALVGFYRANGYLNADVRVDPVSMTGSRAVRRIVVQEGEASRVASVHVEGVHALPADDLAKLLGVSAGDRFTESKLEAAQLALDAKYRTQGYNRVRIDYQAQTVERTSDVAVVVHVDEGPQQRLRDVATTGVSRTNPDIVRRALKLEPGTPVDLAAWNAARRRLYETGAFRSVDIQREVLSAGAIAPAGSEEPVRANVTVQEWPPLRLRYGLEVRDELEAAGDAARSNTPDTEQPGGRTFGFGLAGELGARGLFGSTVSAGVAGRYAVENRATRAYVTSPLFFGRPITSTAFVERSREEQGAVAGSNLAAFESMKTEFTIEQRIRPAKRATISYLYTLERNHTRELDPDPILPFDVTVTTGRFGGTLLLDTRNDLSDASRGWLHSSHADYAPSALGSDIRFVKYFVQQNYYRGVGRVVVAVSGRLGFAKAFDGTTLTPNYRFFAGGGNSVRGYAQDVLSPTDVTGVAVGGNALAVFNQEIRFPIFKIVRGVGFFDAGRAFDRVSDFSFTELFTSAGFGFRVVTPFALLRVDAGVPFDTQFGPQRVRWFFSIGQLF
jgi:outer membrane protein assembly factor BamA